MVQVAIAYRCVRLIAEAAASAPLQVGPGDHPLARERSLAADALVLMDVGKVIAAGVDAARPILIASADVPVLAEVGANLAFLFAHGEPSGRLNGPIGQFDLPGSIVEDVVPLGAMIVAAIAGRRRAVEGVERGHHDGEEADERHDEDLGAGAETQPHDEQRGEDPTTNLLQQRVADLTGKEAAMFLPSGTMCNQIAMLVHCRPGDEIIGFITRDEGVSVHRADCTNADDLR